MSKSGMLGLLEGLGSGLQSTGQTMTKNALIAAQDNRMANRERVRREWMAEQDQNRYDRNRADHATDLAAANARQDQQISDANARQDTIREENRTNQIVDQDKALANRAPSAFKEKIGWFTEQLDSGKITKDQYDSALGLSKSSGMSTKDQVEFRLKAQEQASKEIVGKDPMQAATSEQMEAINQRADEIFNRAIGGGNSGGGDGDTTPKPLSPQSLQTLAGRLAGVSPEERQAEVQEAVADVGEANVKAAIDIIESQKDGNSLKMALQSNTVKRGGGGTSPFNKNFAGLLETVKQGGNGVSTLDNKQPSSRSEKRNQKSFLRKRPY